MFNNVSKLPCPFCGSKEVEDMVEYHEFGENYYCECENCSARGSIASHQLDARYRWNRRIS